MPDDKKIRNPVTDTLEIKENLEKAGFTPEQSSGLAKAIENAGQYLAHAILPQMNARFDAIERTLSRTLTIIAIVGGTLASVILIGFAILGYIHVVN